MVEKVTNEMLQALFGQQLKGWELARRNYEALASVKQREIDFGKFSVRLQYNPARMVSTAAMLEKVEERPCFLCSDNRPREQFEIPEVFGKYDILVNPFPIFNRHFTIPSIKHKPQRIWGNYPDMLDLAFMLDEYVIFYNGAQAGASAPDHMHFQAGNKGFLPIENFWEWGMQGFRLPDTGEDGTFAYVSEGMRMFRVFRSSGRITMIEMMEKYLAAVGSLIEGAEIPMNLLTWYDPDDSNYYSILVARSKHRPDCYYAEGDAKIVVSPGCVDMAGVIILPREEDFNKITREDIDRIYREVSVGKTMP